MDFTNDENNTSQCPIGDADNRGRFLMCKNSLRVEGAAAQRLSFHKRVHHKQVKYIIPNRGLHP